MEPPRCARTRRRIDSEWKVYMATRILIFFAIVGIVVAQSSAQVSMQRSTTGANSFSGTASFGPAHTIGPTVTGAPYSGEEINENVKVLADGTRITQKMMARKVWRDSEGRTRTERPLGMGSNQASMPLIVEITDPVAGFNYTLDTQNKVAHRQVIPPMPSRGVLGGTVGSISTLRGGIYNGPAQATIAGGGGRAGSMGATIAGPVSAQTDAQMRPRFANESIGTRSIDGVIAEGSRSTVTYPVGMMGNDREFSSVTETWMSPDLKIRILSKTNDPRNGESTFHIENLSRTPPDPLLFVHPPDYTVVDEAGSFTIQWGNSPR
jgi:hypothetical protein